MSLRPRYSLLTLLVLTALVAGGVKLWHGPRWVTMSEPWTPSDRVLIEQHPSYPHLQALVPLVTKCQYLNTFAGQELLRIQGQAAAGAELYVADWDTMQNRKVTDEWPDAMTGGSPVLVSSTMFQPDHPRPREKIRCWYSTKLPQPTTEVVELNGMNMNFPVYPTCYFVSDHKQVYQYNNAYYVISVSRVEVSELPDLELRALIEEELAKISQPQ